MNKLTKKDIINQISKKSKTAKPAVRRILLRGLNNHNKAYLNHLLKDMQVTKSGDIHYKRGI
jgi:hypothetical protein